MKNYRALFERAIADLNSNADIDVSVAEIGEPATATRSPSSSTAMSSS